MTSKSWWLISDKYLELLIILDRLEVHVTDKQKLKDVINLAFVAGTFATNQALLEEIKEIYRVT